MSTASRTAFPWTRAIGFGLGVLALAPADFWAMTPRELAAALAGRFGELPAPLDRAVLDGLMQQFPDR